MDSRLIYGNAIPAVPVEDEFYLREHRRRVASRAKRNREKLTKLNPAYVLFLVAAVAVTAFLLINYLNLKSELTTTVNNISQLEKEYANLKMTNDEDYSSVESSINVEEIRRVAIEELGMTYAGDGQIIGFSAEGDDYVRQVKKMEEVASAEK